MLPWWVSCKIFMFNTYVRSGNEPLRFHYNGEATKAIKTEYLVFVKTDLVLTGILLSEYVNLFIPSVPRCTRAVSRCTVHFFLLKSKYFNQHFVYRLHLWTNAPINVKRTQKISPDADTKRVRHTLHHLPRTTSRTGDDVRASCVVKSEAVTWHSHSPSSNSSVAALTQRLQSPESWLLAHSYFLVYMPTGCNRGALHHTVDPFRELWNRAGQLQRTARPNNSLRTRLRAALMYRDIERGGGGERYWIQLNTVICKQQDTIKVQLND